MSSIAKPPNISDYDIPPHLWPEVLRFANDFKMNSEPGFFGGLNKRLHLLYEGKVLIMEHEIYGTYTFQMNPQKNVIFATPKDTRAIEHEESTRVVSKKGLVTYSYSSIQKSPENFVLWGYGDWSVEIEQPKVETVRIETGGVYEKI